MVDTERAEHSTTDYAAELARLYRSHSARIFGFCLYRLANRPEAEDAVQTTFLYAGRALQRGVEPKNEVAWLFTIAHNVCRSSQRSTRRRRRLETQQDPQVLQELSPAIENDNETTLVGLKNALSSIPTGQRHAILLREWRGLPYREIAATLGLTQTAVQMLVFRGRRSLASALDNGDKQSAKKRIGALLDGWGLISLLRTIIGGASAANVTAATGLAVVAIATVGAEDPVQQAQRSVRDSAPPLPAHVSVPVRFRHPRIAPIAIRERLAVDTRAVHAPAGVVAVTASDPQKTEPAAHEVAPAATQATSNVSETTDAPALVAPAVTPALPVPSSALPPAPAVSVPAVAISVPALTTPITQPPVAIATAPQTLP